MYDIFILVTMKSTYDSCKGCRSCYRSLINTIAKSPVMTGIVTSLPTLYLLFSLISVNTYFRTIYGSYLNSLVGILFGISLLVSLVSSASIYYEFHNIVGGFSIVFYALGYWSLVNSFIIITAGWSLITAQYIIPFFFSQTPMTWAWLFAASVMVAYRNHISELVEKRLEPVVVQRTVVADVHV